MIAAPEIAGAARELAVAFVAVAVAFSGIGYLLGRRERPRRGKPPR